MNKQQEGFELELSRKDFDIPTLILGNFANIIIISSRFVSGSDGSNNITYFTYSIFILNAVLTSVIGNISTLLLREISIKKSAKFIYYSLGISVFVGSLLVLFLHYFSYDFIELVFKRGKFGISDVENTSTYLYQLSYSFILIFIATTLFQPFFTLKGINTKNERNNMLYIFLIILFGGIFVLSFLSMDVREKSLILIYSSSFVSVVLSIYSYIVYLRSEKL
jgi:peptidoglycan biosynthesis protein MviN/MurJ (putative lipid II flippase)